MTSSKKLERLAREFAGDVQDLLNRTVTNGVRLSATRRSREHWVAGVGVTKGRWTPAIVPLKAGAKAATAFLQVAYTFEMDPEDAFLAVTRSAIHVHADAHGRTTFFHYDYDRNPTNRYPNPHVQALGESAALAAIWTRSSGAECRLGDIHFPVGGRRFRPTLEDVIEMLAVEHLVVPRAGWEAVVEQHRQRWEEIQVKATVRRHTGWAAQVLRAHGWTVLPPPDDEPGRRRLPEASASSN